MLNIEKYKGIVLKNLNYCKMETDLRKMGAKAVIDCAHTHCENCKEHFFKWLLEEYKESAVLDDVEREYLSAVIKPFRKKVKHIVKINLSGSPEEQFIRIVIGNLDFINLPNFNKNTGMYKGMEVDKLYSLEELGL